MATGECYICCDAGAPPSPCLCVDRFVHPRCQLAQVNATWRCECTVCLVAFPNVEVRETPAAWGLTERGMAVVLMGVVCVTYIATSCVILKTEHTPPWQAMWAFSGVLLAFHICIEARDYTAGVWSFWGVVRREKVARLVSIM